MKAPVGKTLMHLVLVLAIVVLSTAGCGNTSGAPTIPPIETFLIPFETLTANATSSFVSESQMSTALVSLPISEQVLVPLTGSQSNWNYAAYIVGFWYAVVVVGLAVPVAAFRESFHHTPVEQPDGSWVWSYSVVLGSAVYSAELRGEFITEGVRWEMRISKEGEYEDFLWYYGEHSLPAMEGFWILKLSPTNPIDLLRIDWSRNISAGTYAIKYTNIVPGGSENGSYIDFQYTKGIPYDYICDIYNKVEDNHTYIEYSSTTGEGRIKDFEHFGDNDWHCRDSDRMNVTCP